MSRYGYHRVSSTGQKLDRGINEIEDFCKSKGITLDAPIFVDKQTGKNFDRPRYTVLKEDVLRPGDTLIITEVDRLGRNKIGILKELQYFREKGIRVMILELPTTLADIDIKDNLGKLIYDTIQNMIIELYACLAEGELEKKNKRQKEGIEAMKARGDWDDYGRPSKYKEKNFEMVLQQVDEGKIKASEGARMLGISISSFYRYKKEYLKKVS